jgi:hypothetical protein
MVVNARDALELGLRVVAQRRGDFDLMTFHVDLHGCVP